MQPGLPQQGYGGGQGYGGEPQSEQAAPRANGGAAALAGIFALLSAGAMVWVLIEFLSDATDVDSWPTAAWVIVIVRGVLALLLLVLAATVFARKIGAAWTLFLVGLLAAATVVLEPLATEFDLGLWLEGLFQFSNNLSIGIILAAGFGLLAAITALIAGSMKSTPQNESF